MNQLILKLSILFSVLGSSAFAQNSFVSSGGNGNGSGGSVSYSTGQVVYTTSGNSTTIAKGVQQPHEFFIVAGLREESAPSVSLAVFPNPTSDLLTLSNNFNIENLHYQLTDMQGKELDTKKIIAGQNLIDFTFFSASTYFINIIQGTKQVQTFKIIKK